jgi:hypothetical protein
LSSMTTKLEGDLQWAVATRGGLSTTPNGGVCDQDSCSARRKVVSYDKSACGPNWSVLVGALCFLHLLPKHRGIAFACSRFYAMRFASYRSLWGWNSPALESFSDPRSRFLSARPPKASNARSQGSAATCKAVLVCSRSVCCCPKTSRDASQSEVECA